MEKSANKLVTLSVEFAVDILKSVKYLKEQKETIICNQIGRSGTGIGATFTKHNMLMGKRILFLNCNMLFTDFRKS